MAKSISIILAGQSAYFLAGNVFTLIAGFAFQIYLANQLGADGLGVFGLYDAAIGVATSLLGFGLGPSAVKFIPHYLAGSSYSAIRHLLRNGFKLLCIVGCSAYLVILLITIFGSKIFPEHADLLAPLPAMGIMLPLGLLLFFTMQALRGFHDIRYMVMGSSFLQLTAKIIFSIIFFSIGYRLIGYIWAVVLSSTAALLWMLRGLKRHVPNRSTDTVDAVTESMQGSWHGYAKVMYGNSLLSTIAVPLDRFLVGFFVGASGVGILMAVKVLQQLPGIFLQMFLAVVAPMFAAANAKKDFSSIQELYCLTTDWLMRLALPLLSFLTIFAGQILGMYGEIFREQGTYPLYFLLLSQLISLGCGPIGNVLNMAGQETIMLRVSIIQTALSVVGLITLTPLYGLVGASIVILLTTSFVNLAALYFASKRLSLHWWDKKYLRWFIPTTGSVAFCYFIVNSVGTLSKLELLFYLICNYLVFHLLHLVLGVNGDDKEVFQGFLTKLKRMVPGIGRLK